ncbi:MAG: DegT/DnrJ/EryC1/StrS family aminotransferase, partial [Candidatus Omnitrophica bacterium]|nr:DegT/DnrJ/EryC1/StrS family aminotransferase [Candidatus Omnitrophota bacterium]
EKDWNHYPSETEAKVGLIQLQKYDDAIKKRVANAKVYIEKFGSNDDVNILPLTDGATYSHCVALVEDREQWVTQFRKKKIQLGVLIEYAIPDMPAYREYRRGDYPVSQYYSKHAINFPNWPGVDRFKEISKLSSV